MSTVEFDVVEGMHCAACVKRMQTALAGQPGVSDVQIDLIGRRVAMQLSPRGLDVTAVQARLGKFGFTVRPLMTRLPASTTEEVSRAVIAGALAAACMVWAMAAAHHPASPWVQGALVIATMAWPGRTLLVRAGRSLLHLRGDMDVLVGLGAVAAMVHGLVGLWLGWPHLHFESAAAIIAFTLAGRALESRGRAAAGAAVEALLARQPLQASRLLPNGSDERIPAARVRIDDRLRVRPGDVLPADGLVESGGGEVDEALLSGEPLPVAKGVGDAVHAGTINLLGSMVVRVGAASGATRLDAIAAAMRAAAAAKPPIARLADRVAAVFVPLAILLALATVAGWWWLGGPEGWRTGIIAGMSVLVIACPCALGLATPAAVAVAVGRAARAGILIRDGAAIETLAVVRAAVIDKTGTITTGMPQLAEAVCAPGCDRATLLTLAAAAESGSEHPVARAVLLAAQGLQVPASEGFAATPGGGIRAVVAGGEVLVGTRAFLGGHGIAVPPSEPRGPGMLAHVAANGRWIGVLRLGDGPRPAAQHELARLRALGLRLHLASGDRVAEAQRVAAAVGIGDAHGGLSPEAKARLVEDLERAGDRVLALGDGINDAPMLARASAGAAVGGGAEIAALAGNLILHGRDPLALAADAVELARATMRTIRRNLLFAAGYNLIAIPLAASGRLDPMWASAAMASSSLCVIASSLLLARWRRRA
jgi:P-type Cu+ transporter